MYLMREELERVEVSTCVLCDVHFEQGYVLS